MDVPGVFVLVPRQARLQGTRQCGLGPRTSPRHVSLNDRVHERTSRFTLELAQMSFGSVARELPFSRCARAVHEARVYSLPVGLPRRPAARVRSHGKIFRPDRILHIFLDLLGNAFGIPLARLIHAGGISRGFHGERACAPAEDREIREYERLADFHGR